MTQKTKNIIGWIITILVALVFALSAYMKFTTNDETIKAAATFGISMPTLQFFGALELAAVILFMINRTGILGTLLVASYLGGAIATHVEHGLPVYMPIIIECLVWIAAVLRFPELTRRLMNNEVIA